jgi:hypothetical protein
MKKDEPYQCDDPKCSCHKGSRHCPICGKLYLYNNTDKRPCIVCDPHVRG